MLSHVVALPSSRAYCRSVPCSCSRICPAACTRQCFVHAYTAGSWAIRPKMPQGNQLELLGVLPTRSKKLSCWKVSPWKFFASCSLEDFETPRLARSWLAHWTISDSLHRAPYVVILVYFFMREDARLIFSWCSVVHAWARSEQT